MSVYHNTWASLVRFCQAEITELRNDSISEDLTYYDFDASANVEALPNNDILGLSGFGLDVVGKQFYITTLFCVSTKDDDENLTRHRKIIGLLMEKLLPTKTIEYVDAEIVDTNLGFMVITDGTGLNPIARSNTRGLQAVEVTLICSVGT